MTNVLARLRLFDLPTVIQMFSLHLPLRTVDMIHVAGRTGLHIYAFRYELATLATRHDVGVLTLVQHLPHTKVSKVDLYTVFSSTFVLQLRTNGGF